jgi:mannosylfructose-phosphate synthase
VSQITSTIQSIAMLSTHGFVDPVPQLGSTDTGGQVVYVLELAKALAKSDIRVDIYTRWFDRSRPQIDPLSGSPQVRVIRIPAGPWEFIPKEVIYDVLPELADNMVAFIQKGGLDYDLFHGHYVDGGDVALAVAARTGCPAFFTAHSLGAWKRQQMGGDPATMEARFNFARRIADELEIFKTVRAQTVTSDLQRQKIHELYGFEADNIVTIPPGVDVHTFRPLEPGEQPSDTALPGRYIFCLSRIDTSKGHDFLLRAFDRVRRQVPDVELVIGGGSPSPQPRELEVRRMMHEIIDETDLHGRVHIISYVPDALLAPYYRQAELFALPSLFEPFGMTAIEAMASGTPVVASRLGGIRTVINSGQDGLLVDPSDPDEFAEAMVAILQDDDLRQRLGRAGRETVRAHYSWEAIAERHIALYQRYLAR